MTADLIDQLAAAIAAHMPRRIPLAVDLWSHAEIAAYLKVDPRQVGDRYALLPGFPRAITRLAKVLDVLPLAKAIGHKDLRMLMVYYNPTAEELGKLLK